MAIDASKKYEINFLPRTMIKLEIEDVEKDTRVQYIAKPLVIAKPKTFFQKYGPYIAIAVSFGMQVRSFGRGHV